MKTPPQKRRWRCQRNQLLGYALDPLEQGGADKHEFSHSKYLQLFMVKSSRPRWQYAAVSGYIDSRAVVELDLQNVRDVIGQKATHQRFRTFPRRKTAASRHLVDGPVCDSTSKEFITMPVVRLEANGNSSAWIATNMAGTLNVSNMDCVMCPCRPDSSYFLSKVHSCWKARQNKTSNYPGRTTT